MAAMRPCFRVLADEVVDFLDCRKEAEGDFEAGMVSVEVGRLVDVKVRSGKNAKQPHVCFFFAWRPASSCRFFSQ
jgi:hypothetical protein